ncbi:MAG TPA: VOC family protein [Xanthomonadaceae bacterium]|jgi:uncharacterized glyoxalase superfamily protein PhnB|nr:VOC family protein [Xanthomonadaceae bacterium]
MGENLSMPACTVIPVLAYPDVRKAVEFLCAYFGFAERLRIGDHRSQLVFGDGAVVVTGPATEESANSFAHSIMVRVENVDDHFAHAQVSGIAIAGQPTTHPYGERQYTVTDIGGHRWTFSQTVENVDPEDWGGQLLLR